MITMISIILILVDTLAFDGSDIFPMNHPCSKCCFKELQQLNINDRMNSCDILSSIEGTSFLLLNPNGTLEIYKDDILIWSSCDEYRGINQIQCHHKLANSELFIDNNTGILTLFDPIQSIISWKKGYYANSNVNRLEINDKGDLLLLNEESTVLWTSDTEFESEGNWKLILSHNCTEGSYFNEQTSRQFGTISDGIYSDLIILSELKYQKDNSYLFKMRWPQNIEILDLVWKQSTNPSADHAVQGFESLMDPYQRITWSGLALSSKTYSDKSLINGDNSGGWGLPIAVYYMNNTDNNNNNNKQCLPGPNIENEYVEMVELLVKEYNDLSINAGQSFITENEDKKQTKGELMIVGYPKEAIIESNDSNNWPIIAIQRILGKVGEIEAFCECQDGTAIQNEDYIYTRKEFKWLDQETITKIIQIPIIDDNIFEFDEYFIVHCDSLSSDVPISINDIKITIKGPNDIINGKVMVLRNNDRIWINESIGNLILQIQPTTHDNELQIKYTTKTINAQCGEEQDEIDEIDGNDIDYMNVSGILYWSSHDITIQNITIKIINDSLWENDECFNLILYDETMIHDNVTICIYANDDPLNCSDTHWSDWSRCNVEYGIGQKIRYKHIGDMDSFGTIHCETQIETQSCTGNMSYISPADIILSSHSVNLSENGVLYNLPQTSKITLKLTTLPISNKNKVNNNNNNLNNIKLIESNSLIEIILEINPEIFNFIDFEPAYIAFNDMDWSLEKDIRFTAINDDAFTANQIITKIEFKVNSIDERYHNISIQPLLVYIFDDDLIQIQSENNSNKINQIIDIRMLIAIILLIITCICLCLSYLRRRYIQYKEWKSHHNLYFDQLVEEQSDDDQYSDFSEMNLDEPDFS